MQCRTAFANARLLSRIPKDIAWILRGEEVEVQDNHTAAGDLWDDKSEGVIGGVNYGGEEV